LISNDNLGFEECDKFLYYKDVTGFAVCIRVNATVFVEY
jgi:hypothetical protein